MESSGISGGFRFLPSSLTPRSHCALRCKICAFFARTASSTGLKGPDRFGFGRKHNKGFSRSFFIHFHHPYIFPPPSSLAQAPPPPWASTEGGLRAVTCHKRVVCASEGIPSTSPLPTKQLHRAPAAPTPTASTPLPPGQAPFKGR